MNPGDGGGGARVAPWRNPGWRAAGPWAWLALWGVLVPPALAHGAGLPSAAPGSVAAQQEAERKALFDVAANAVVFVRCGDDSIGSGFLVDAAGLILTNRHVVECDDSVSVILRTGEKRKGKIVAKDPIYDLALLRIKADGLQLSTLALADSDAVEVADYAAAVSHPVGGVWTFNDGLISNRYPAKHDQYAGILQAQVPLQPGSSGGPLLNRRGDVVGIVTAKLRTGDNMIFCIQSNLARRLLGEYQGNANGQLAVNGNIPGAELIVDGKVSGTLPALLTLPVGAHAIEVRAKGRTHRRDITLQKGRVEQVFVKPEDLR
ncbi:MAG: trypsin-like peptidase domain-containing protein [Deltaproteobacteria bacterium]|nr:trypsin-like peptidase domain-containing protein [Deltaproteobacteria bacterium]